MTNVEQYRRLLKERQAAIDDNDLLTVEHRERLLADMDDHVLTRGDRDELITSGDYGNQTTQVGTPP